MCRLMLKKSSVHNVRSYTLKKPFYKIQSVKKPRSGNLSIEIKPETPLNKHILFKGSSHFRMGCQNLKIDKGSVQNLIFIT